MDRSVVLFYRGIAALWVDRLTRALYGLMILPMEQVTPGADPIKFINNQKLMTKSKEEIAKEEIGDETRP